MRVFGVYLGSVWNGLNTVAGLLFVLAGGATFARIDPRWGAMLWVAKPGRWLLRFMAGGGVFGLVKGGISAITVGEVIVVAAPGHLVNARLLAHENRHVWQGFLLGYDQTDSMYAQSSYSGATDASYVQLVFQGVGGHSDRAVKAPVGRGIQPGPVRGSEEARHV